VSTVCGKGRKLAGVSAFLASNSITSKATRPDLQECGGHEWHCRCFLNRPRSIQGHDPIAMFF